MVIDGEELISLIIIWVIAISSICYCYYISARFAPGVPRLLSLLPVITVFSILPLPISTVHLAFPTFFYLVWLANFKLLLFAFNRGPLSSKLPILPFVAFALLAINPKQPQYKLVNPLPLPLLKHFLLVLKALILIIIVHVYQHKDNLHWAVVMVLYISHMYVAFELGLAFTTLIVKILLGFNYPFEAQYNEPYLATSLQDFWGRRWNLVTSIVLRDTVYNPVRGACTPTLGRLRGQMLAIFVTFVVSGFMHELMYYYVMRVRPTWEVTWFFVLHGACTAIEVAVKDAAKGKFKLHRLVSGPLTLVFMFVTAGWLFMVQPLRNGVDAKIIYESSILLQIF